MAKVVKGVGHPILDKVYQVGKDLVEEKDILDAPTNPSEFLNWWWNTYGEACTRCVLSEKRTLVVKPDGKISPRGLPQIMIVGEGPGIMEDLTGVPMVSPLTLRSSRCGWCLKSEVCYAHKMLEQPTSRHPKNRAVKCQPQPSGKLQLVDKFYLQSAGSILDGVLIKLWKFNYPRQSWIDLYNKLHPDQPWVHESPWFITNTVLCRSFDLLTLKDTVPGTAPKNICKKWLMWQWAAVNPAVIICLGRPALEAFTQAKERPHVIDGEIFHTAHFGPIIYQPHPARLMREDNLQVQGLGFAKLAKTLRLALEYSGYPTKE